MRTTQPSSRTVAVAICFRRMHQLVKALALLIEKSLLIASRFSIQTSCTRGKRIARLMSRRRSAARSQRYRQPRRRFDIATPGMGFQSVIRCGTSQRFTATLREVLNVNFVGLSVHVTVKALFLRLQLCEQMLPTIRLCPLRRR